jgi:hypothetical protein
MADAKPNRARDPEDWLPQSTAARDVPLLVRNDASEQFVAVRKASFATVSLPGARPELRHHTTYWFVYTGSAFAYDIPVVGVTHWRYLPRGPRVYARCRMRDTLARVAVIGHGWRHRDR